MNAADQFEVADVRCTRATEKALCCFFPNDETPHWIAKSQIRAGSTVRDVGDRGVLVISMWLARTAKLTAPGAGGRPVGGM